MTDKLMDLAMKSQATDEAEVVEAPSADAQE